MGISSLSAVARSVQVTDDQLQVQLKDARSLVVPLVWFPTLLHATALERQEWRLMGGGLGIHWEMLDEDISVPRLLGLPCE